MDDYIAVLSSIVADRVRYYELVKVTIHTSTRKSYILVADRAIFFVTFNLSGVIKDSKIEYSNVEDVILSESGRKITLKLGKSLIQLKNEGDLGVHEIHIETPDYTVLYEKVKIAIDTHHMINSFKDPNDEDKINIEHKNIIKPFYKYKKVTFGGYYFFLKDSFKDTTFNTMYTKRYEDDRGITMTVNIKDPTHMYYIENDELYDLYNYTRRFIQELELVSSFSIDSYIKDKDKDKKDRNKDEDTVMFKENIQVLRDDVYYKKMNLNSDISKWLCYHVLVRTSTKFILYFILRRLFIPPMLDVCQDILIRFDLVLTENNIENITSYWNEFCITINSITSNTNQFTWNKELIELRINNLRYKNEMYKHLKLNFNIVPSYFNLIKSFIVSTLKLLPAHSFDQYIIYKLNDDNNVEVYTDEPLEYVYKITSSLFGDNNNRNNVIINKFTMRLANYITYAMDELVIGNELLLSLIVKNMDTLDPSIRKKLDNVLKFLMHFRSINFNEKYSNNTFNNIFDHYNKSGTGNAKGDLDWNNTVFNYYATSRLLEEGYIKLLFNSNVKSDFDNPTEENIQNRIDSENGYILLICTLIEKYNDYSLHKRIIRNLIDLPVPIPDNYLSIVPPMVNLLSKTNNENLMKLILSLLINFTYHNDNSKELMINNNISLILGNYIYIKDHETLLLCLKLILNLTKIKLYQMIFLKSGMLYHLINILHKYFNDNDNIEIVSHISATIGQLYNIHNITLQFNKLEYIVDIMLYVYINFNGTMEQFNNILFCVKKISNNRQLSLKVGKQLIPVLLANMNYVDDNNYLINIFELLLKLADHVPNCIIMKENNISNVLEGLNINVDVIIQFSIQLSNKIRKKTIHCNI